MQVQNHIYSDEKWEQVNQENKDIVTDYLEEIKAQRKKPSTQKQYRWDLQFVMIYILEHCNNKPITKLNRKDFRRFLLWLTDDLKVSNARANRIMSVVRTLLDFVEQDEDYDYDQNMAAKVKGLQKEEVRDIVFLEDEVILDLWNKFMKEERYKEATLLGLLYDSGCRKNEIAQVSRSSITQDGNASNFVIGKRGKRFQVLYFRLTKEAFQKYNESRDDILDFLFITDNYERASLSTIYDWVTKWRKDLQEITGENYAINVHTFRHCFINNMLNGTHYLCRELSLGSVPLEKVKALAHHESSDTTLHYAEDTDTKDIENLFGIKLS